MQTILFHVEQLDIMNKFGFAINAYLRFKLTVKIWQWTDVDSLAILSFLHIKI